MRLLISKKNNKKKNKQSGYTLIELMIWFAIFLLIATPIARYLYREEIEKYERHFFNALGIGEIGQTIIIFFLAITVIYLKVRPDIIEAKRKNKPIIGKGVKLFSIFAFITVGVLLAVNFI